MDRREVLKSLGAAAVVSFSAGGAELFAATHAARRRLQSMDEEGRYVYQTLASDMSARVPELIDLLLTDWFDEDERGLFLRGLRDLEDRAQASGGRGFVSLTEPEQVEILRAVEAEALAEARPAPATHREIRDARSSPRAPFFTVLKWLTLYGYFTSEVGMERELSYVDFPGSYEGCMPLSRK
jgi:glucoside 3-dehydrogenase (cytochrome c) hitch-hiker subunit